MRVVIGAISAAVGIGVGPWLALLADRVPERKPLGGGVRGVPGVVSITIGTAVLFAAFGVRLGANWEVPGFLAFAACLVVVTVTDLRLFLIPNRIVYPSLLAAAVLLSAAALITHDFVLLRHAAVGGAGAWAALLVMHLINPKGMAFGDVRLAAVIGVYEGWLGLNHVVLALFLGFVAAAVVGGAVIVTRRRGAKDPVPFGPFLAVGAVAVVLAGTTILHWYRG